MTTQTRIAALVLATMLAVGCFVAVVVILRELGTDAAKQTRQVQTDARELVKNKNVAVAQLENHDTARSAPVFAEIAAALPDDPLGPRNWTVARVLALGEEFERATPEALESAREALALMRKVEGATGEWRWLAARADAAAQDFSAAADHLAAITRDEPRNASAWYELFLAHNALNRPGAQADAMSAVARALELKPENLFVVVEYLRKLEDRAGQQRVAIERLPAEEREAASRRALGEHGDVAAQLRQVRQTLTPFQDRLMAIGHVDIVQLMDEAIAAAENADLERLAERAGQVARITLGMAAPDRNHIRRHVLEFALVRFRPEFYQQHALVEAEPIPAIEVSFSATPAQQLGDQLREMMTDARSVKVADFDLDGRMDIFVLAAAGIYVFARTDDSAAWELISQSKDAAGMTGLVVQDFDLDFDEMPVIGPRSKVQGHGDSPSEEEAAQACASADVDVVAFGPSGVMVLRNRYSNETKQRTLEPLAQSLAGLSDTTAATAADIDGDGDLDLAITSGGKVSVWSNRGNATFEDISARSSLPPSDATMAGFVAVDWDRDVDIDILVSGEPAGWLENLRHGQMRWQAFDNGFGVLNPVGAMEVVDADSNASWDLIGSTSDGLRLVRTTTPQPGVVRAMDTRSVSDRSDRGLLTWDYDNDGVSDLLAWDDQLSLYRGLAGGGYQQADLLKKAPAAIRDCAVGDLDGDGDLDIAIVHADGVTILVNEGGNANRWLDVGLKARQIKGSETSASGRVNAHGVGSLMEIKAAVRYQAAVVRGQSTHLGLGRNSSADVVRVMWLNGVPQNVVQPAPQRVVCEQQLLTGSCPYLYTWNGTAYEFVTDLLWASPLGLQAADGVLVPWREWEYIKIAGEKLRPRNGEYILQLTEELWEAAYFDEVRLIAIDHPADIDVYSNEKVGPAEIAQFGIHTARTKRRPIAARNHRGRDLLAELAEEDGNYARAFDKKLRQGLVEQHFIELDLGDLRDAQRITLFLTGWIYPSGTSVNVAVSRNPELVQPQPPAIFVPDGQGGWREALAYMGFPGGKTKTIALDLSQVLTPGDGRLRIATNLELYWDQIFFTVDEPAVEMTQHELTLRSADLHPRGFSKVALDPGNGPERFLYHDVSKAPKWPPMQGRFTRYGDVTELLGARDDRLLVIGAGDEATLRYAVPDDDPPPGWKRDFLLYSVGWDKDANLCTVLGQTVEPLPYARMKNYPPGADDEPPSDAAYGRYLHEYQTRRQDVRFWRDVLGGR